MWTFERDMLAEDALAYCKSHHMQPTPHNILAALDILNLLRDTIDRRAICPECGNAVAITPNYTLVKKRDEV